MAKKKATTCFFTLSSWLTGVSLIYLTWIIFSATAENSMVEVKVGVILDSDTVGKVGLSCLKMALSDFYEFRSFYNTRLVLHVRDSNKDVVRAASAALDLIENEEVEAIIGPQTSTQANFIINLSDKARVPIISFSATSAFLASLRSPYFFQATQNDSTQVHPITALVQAFGWRQVVPIYVDNQYGESIVPYLTDALQNVNVKVPYRSAIPAKATDDQIALELYKLMTMQSRVFVVHMWPSLGSRLFTKAEEIGLMDKGYVWIVTNGLADLFSMLNSTVVGAMQGVLGVKTHVPRRQELESFRVRWKREFQREYPGIVDDELNVFGLWAYDAAFALAMAVEKVVGNGYNGTSTSTGLGLVRNYSGNSSTDLDNFGVSRNGMKLRDELLRIRFRGLAGDFSLVNGKLQSSTFEIVNVNGNGKRLVGFWTPRSGLTRKLNLAANATSNSNLGPVLWPGDTLPVPEGWVTPTNGKKLRVGIPVKSGNSTFVQLKRDPNTNRTQVTGFCIDVFNAAIDAMPYAVPVEFMPFAKSNGQSAGSYNDMIYQVYLGNFDAVAADVTIIANRSLYVDFTMPYTDSGVTMIVPIKGIKTKNAWVFLKPLTLDLWVTTGCFFVFIGFVVWLLEHRINEDFRGPPSHQIGTSFWFSFSTMVFAHREQVVSNLARFVVVIWCFVVLILTQSYTASLTSLLTVQQLRPTLTDVNELLKNKENIGFPNGSFVLAMLTAFDEIPYMKVFIAKHCSKYSMVGPIYKTDGFGFAFPRGSPLVGDVSRAILNMSEGDKMKKIENAWFISDTVCPDSSAMVTSESLGLNSFWGLFLLAGTASLSALTLFIATFLYKHRKIMTRFDSEASLWQRIRVVLRIFNEKDLSSHTFKKNIELQNSSPSHVTDAVNGSPNTNFPPSPSCYSNQTEFNFAFHEEPETPFSAQN